MFAIANTDLEWFDRLRAHPVPQVINFWTPTPWGLQGLSPDDRFYFMLKAPVRKIGGYGLFVSYTESTASAAWDLYGTANGVDSRERLIARIKNFASKRSTAAIASDPVIGCISLRAAVFLQENEFVSSYSVGHSFPKEVVKYKYFSATDMLAPALGVSPASTSPFALVTGVGKRQIVSRKERKGQSQFRQMVLANYGYRCSITSEAIPEVLEASHIQPYIDARSDHPQNGLCLRADLHHLFDGGMITIGADMRLQVSSRLVGSSYEGLGGQRVRLPSAPADHPSPTALHFHRTDVYR
ncbi:HNH endonuclease [Rhizobium sp. BT-175]|uniref:HNH endonuclease n=1 Tax=Rhizobium sp. BT-175 TaxID=2986929 RepID=UPI002235ECCC|nr:HNH endonuclease signature motif containing protein [Rhizobium sp. BT-175]MCV9944914.1 HNH endonuclease [Rhizobium sp. BT-175]